MDLEKLVNESQAVAKEWGMKLVLSGESVTIESLSGRKFAEYELKNDGCLLIGCAYVGCKWPISIPDRIGLESVVRIAAHLHKEINKKRDQEIKERNAKPESKLQLLFSEIIQKINSGNPDSDELKKLTIADLIVMADSTYKI